MSYLWFFGPYPTHPACARFAKAMRKLGIPLEGGLNGQDDVAAQVRNAGDCEELAIMFTLRFPRSEAHV